MSFFDLNNDVNSIISKHLSDDYKISAMFKHLFHDFKISTLFMSKQYELQTSLFGEIVFDDDFDKIKKINDDINDDDDDDFNNGKIYKISFF